MKRLLQFLGFTGGVLALLLETNRLLLVDSEIFDGLGCSSFYFLRGHHVFVIGLNQTAQFAGGARTSYAKIRSL